MKTLPSKPSELIKLALNDLEVVEKDDRYVVDMDTWHEPVSDSGTCIVCLAGAVIANSLKYDIKKSISLSRFDNDTGDKILAIDCFRMGRVSFPCYSMGFNVDIEGMKVTKYQDNPIQFKKDMLSMANKLQELGH